MARSSAGDGVETADLFARAARGAKFRDDPRSTAARKVLSTDDPRLQDKMQVGGIYVGIREDAAAS
jgi:hypothetical protein